MTVDFHATESHLVDHLLPVWLALPEEARNTFHLPTHYVRHLLSEIPGASELHPDKRAPRPLVGASWGDVAPHRKHRPVGLMEHGAGATYPGRNPAFAGGTDREGVCLFLAPNEHVRAANAEWYPDVPNVVVGTPLMDVHHRRSRPRTGRVVCFTWHWSMLRWQGGRSALDHHLPGLRAAADELRGRGWDVIGSAHPRAWHKPPNVAAAYDRAGIEPVEDFAEVVERSSVMAADVTSAAWLSASAGVAQVVLEAPWYADAWEQRVWPRFDPGLPLGPLVKDPDGIVGAVLSSHAAWHGVGMYQRSVAEVVPHRDGRCAQRAADTICEFLL